MVPRSALFALIGVVAISAIVFAYFVHDVKKKRATKKAGPKVGIADLSKYIKNKKKK